MQMGYGMDKSRSGKIRIIAAGVVCVMAAILCAFYGYAVYCGLIQLNNPSQKRYPVRGVDVSHYQGTIDWPVLAAQDLDFAYIKATEGSSHTDEKFAENWEAAKDTGLRIGAYHFFSFDSPGESQLKHFTETVPAFRQMLPPVVDFEFYGDKKVNPPERETVCAQLDVMLQGLEAHYGVKPVIYATEDTMHLYLEGRYEEYPLWIRNVMKKPDTGNWNWVFWQYTNRKKLNGYEGDETYIDMNVFGGDRDAWEFWSRNYEMGWNYRPGWGSFRPDPQYSGDGRYLAVQDVVTDESTGLQSVRVTIQDGESGERIFAFITDRARDFWGICWEPGTDRIWTQSADTGLRCYECTEQEWRYNPEAERPAAVISKYDSYDGNG